MKILKFAFILVATFMSFGTFGKIAKNTIFKEVTAENATLAAQGCPSSGSKT